MMNTVKTDWFTDLLAEEGALVSGHPSFSSRLGLPDSARCAIRFMGNKEKIYVYLLTVECDKSLWNRVAAALNDGNLLFVQMLSRFFRTFPVILFDPDMENVFGMFARGSTPKKYSAEELAEYFGTIDPALTMNAGSVKEINASVNDVFQSWTRRSLSRYATINDIDAMHLNMNGSKSLLFELKRVKESVDTWEPYLDDWRNYATFMSVCLDLYNAHRVIAYNPEPSPKVALHWLTEATQGAIKGKRLICTPKHACALEMGDYYESNRRRLK